MKRIRWCCVNYNFADKPYFLEESMKYTRKQSIAWFIEGTKKPWRHWRDKIGWRCIKVEMTIEPVN